MKKLLAILAIVGLVGGCCTGTNSAGKATKNPINCIKPVATFVDEKICPTVEMVKEAASALPFLKADPKLYAAWSVFDFLSKGICVAASQLKMALAEYDSTPFPMGFGGKVALKPELTALRAAVKR